MSTLHDRLSYLALADFDYLSARLLLLFGLVNTALPKAAEAFEKILKLAIILEARINQNKEISLTELKKSYGHNLTKLFEEIKSRTNAQGFDSSWNDYFKSLQDSYKKRYPEEWTEWRLVGNIDLLDEAYAIIRGNVVPMFPLEEQERAQQFGTFIGDVYSQEFIDFIKKKGVLPPNEILFLRNSYLDKMKIEKSKVFGKPPK